MKFSKINIFSLIHAHLLCEILSDSTSETMNSDNCYPFNSAYHDKLFSSILEVSHCTLSGLLIRPIRATWWGVTVKPLWLPPQIQGRIRTPKYGHHHILSPGIQRHTYPTFRISKCEDNCNKTINYLPRSFKGNGFFQYWTMFRKTTKAYS
jgi:hypothetical protein